MKKRNVVSCRSRRSASSKWTVSFGSAVPPDAANRHRCKTVTPPYRIRACATRAEMDQPPVLAIRGSKRRIVAREDDGLPSCQPTGVEFAFPNEPGLFFGRSGLV